jgi:hypothetical protein
MGNIYVSPIGGLANRLRMIISSKILANYLNYNHFIINWIDNDNYVGFDTLFKVNNEFKLATVVPNNSKFIDLSQNIINLNEIKIYENIVIQGYDCIGIYTPIIGLPKENEKKWELEYKEGYKKLQLIDNIKSKIQILPENTVGIQIRRYDNIRSINNSPIELFIDKIEKHIDSSIFLTTDDIYVENILKTKYPKIITTQKKGYIDNKLIRSDLIMQNNGVKTKENLKNALIEAVIDAYVLSQCNIIYGSYWSSFGELSSYLTDTILITLKK